MSNDPNQNSQGLIKSVTVLGSILGVVVGLFGLVQLVTQQPGIALFVASIGALISSGYFIRKGYLIETIVAWLAVIVVGLAIFVLIPRSGTVTGVVYDAEDHPLLNEPVLLVDSRGVERRARTGADGRYVFTDVPAGPFELLVGEVRTGGEITTPLVRRQEFNVRLPRAIAADTPSPTPTDTPSPTPTDTPSPTTPPPPPLPTTPPPPPPPCPLLEIFPQASACDTFFVFKNEGGVLEDTFKSTGACVRSGSFGLELAYSNAGPANAGWGVQWIDTPAGHFDASGFSQFRFWVRGDAGEETFQIGIKDTSEREAKVESRVLTVVSTQWAPVTVDLSAFAGISLSSIANVNLGFNVNHGSGTICIDDLEFIP